jgi:hypothetical protein
MYMKKILLIGSVIILGFLFFACGKRSSPDNIDLTGFYKTLKTKFDLPEQVTVQENEKETLFPGLSDIKLKQSVLMVPKDPGFSHEILLAEAESEKDAAKLAEIFEEHRDALQDKWSTGLADQLKLVNDAVSKTNGRYVLLAIDPSADRIGSEFDKLFKK